MVNRTLAAKIRSLSQSYSVISVTGPRQSGKTTLVTRTFPNYFYANLESLDARRFAQEDPKAFLSQSPEMIIDEIQYVPELLSYIQVIVDGNKERKFIITGSQNFLITEKVSQSLAGRVAIFTLLPLSIDELKNESMLETNLIEQIFKGFYPRLYDEDLDIARWYNDYIQTYLERDVRQIKNIDNLGAFHRFLGLIAGRTGQVLSMNSLANDVGVSIPTIESWISILEASHIVFRLQPYYENFNKRLVKSPKIHFVDTGLVCSLLGISSPKELRNHPLLGSIFETFAVSSIIKNFYNNGDRAFIFYWKDKTGKEIDTLFKLNEKMIAAEIKVSSTISSDMASHLLYFKELAGKDIDLEIIYGGDENQIRSEYQFISWRNI